MVPLHDGEFGAARRRDGGRRLEQHGDVEVVLEQIAGFDGALVAAVDENDALAFQMTVTATAGIGSAAAARRAAIFGPALGASRDQPAVSRILA